MSNETEQGPGAEKPLVEQYVEADQRYHDLLHQVFPLRAYVRGEAIEPPQRSITAAVVEELQELEAEVDRLRDAFLNER